MTRAVTSVAVLLLFILGTMVCAMHAADVKTLITQLADKHELVPLKAAKSLGKLAADAKDAIPALTDALNSKYFTGIVDVAGRQPSAGPFFRHASSLRAIRSRIAGT